MPHVQLMNLFRKFNYELEFFDDQETVAEFQWLRYAQVFLVDYTRITIFNKLSGREEDTDTYPYPLKWSLWRLFLIGVSYRGESLIRFDLFSLLLKTHWSMTLN
jgi:hypothetical protein